MCDEWWGWGAPAREWTAIFVGAAIVMDGAQDELEESKKRRCMFKKQWFGCGDGEDVQCIVYSV